MEKPKFNAVKKIDHSKTDKILYAAEIENSANLANTSLKNKTQISQKENESDNLSMTSSNISLSKKINPIK
jgi:hypothetical protein